MLDRRWGQNQGLSLEWGIGSGWSSQRGLAGRGVAGPTILYGLPLALTVHLSHCH